MQSVDGDALMGLATEHDLVVRIAVPSGAFVTPADTLMTVVPGDRVNDDMAAALAGVFVVGDERTPGQDLAFSIRRIVEIAQRALSPGINDPTTALYCIDRLGEAFARVIEREIPLAERFDDEGRPRVLATTASFEDMACAAFAAVARYGSNDPDVAGGLAAALSRVIATARPEGRKKLGQLREAILGKGRAHRLFDVGAKMDTHTSAAPTS